MQLWSIHAFARVDDAVRQVPLAYVIMSSKRRRDYIAILQELLEALEDRDMDCALKVVVGDFEAAVWQAFSPGIII